MKIPPKDQNLKISKDSKQKQHQINKNKLSKALRDNLLRRKQSNKK